MRREAHLFIDWILGKSNYISLFSLLSLTVIDISDLDNYTLRGVPIGKLFYAIVLIIAIVFGIASIQESKDMIVLEDDLKKKSKKIKDLESNLNKIQKETNELFNFYIKLLSNKLNFEHTERISIYKNTENTFVLLARTSENPNYATTGRASYPIDEGFIANGWAQGSYFIKDLPDPGEIDGYYEKIKQHCTINREIIVKLKMKSRSYYVQRLDGFDSTPRAIIVFESTANSSNFKKEEIVRNLEDIKEPLTMFIQKSMHRKQEEKDNKMGL